MSSPAKKAKKSGIDFSSAASQVDKAFADTVVPTLCEYIKIENASPAFDPDWASNGSLDKVIDLFFDWTTKQNVPGLQVEKVTLPGRTPCLLLELPARGCSAQDAVLLYAHGDKQPPLTEDWSPGLGPYTPVIKDDKLYGRGGADDGYGLFAAVTALQVLQAQGLPHKRVVVLIETCEESGSYDLPHYVDHLSERLGDISLVVCLDSGAADYERMWMTTSLRGMLFGDLRIDVLPQGCHSGHAGGIVPSSFRIQRQLISRIEDEATGDVIAPPALVPPVPEAVKRAAKLTAEIVGDDIVTEFGMVGGKAESDDLAECLIRRTYQANVSVVGVEGIPPLKDAGNVRRAYTTLSLSIRLPPQTDQKMAADEVKRLLEKDPPYGAKVTFKVRKCAGGFEAPALQPWLQSAVDEGSTSAFGNAAGQVGEGGSIPFMGLLLGKFPKAQFVVTGVLGPHSNAHGPDEMLHLPMAKKITMCIANILYRHADV